MKSVSGTRRSGFSKAEVSADTYLTVILPRRLTSPLRISHSINTDSIFADVILCDSGLPALSFRWILFSFRALCLSHLRPYTYCVATLSLGFACKRCSFIHRRGYVLINELMNISNDFLLDYEETKTKTDFGESLTKVFNLQAFG